MNKTRKLGNFLGITALLLLFGGAQNISLQILKILVTKQFLQKECLLKR